MPQTFTINETDEIRCYTRDAPTGFKHVCEYWSSGKKIESRQTSYYNRTWEKYTYQTAIGNLLDKMDIPDNEKDAIMEHVEDQALGRVREDLKTTVALSKFASLMSSSPEQSNDLRLKTIRSRYPAISVPSDWDQLPENEKKRRLDAIEDMMAGV